MNRLEIKSTGINKDGLGTISLIRDKKHLDISFAGNLDLYFTLYTPTEDTTFIINKDNYPVYLLFTKLYQTIISGNIFPIDKENIIKECELSNLDYHQILLEKELQNQERISNFKAKAQATGLIKNNIITWLSDDFSSEIAPYFTITKVNDYYVFEFFNNSLNNASKNDLDYFFLKIMQLKNNHSVRIRNSGSSYEPFNVCFMKLYQELITLSQLDYEQIGIEEYQILASSKENNPKRVLHKK